MGRVKANIPNLVALAGALELYRQAAKLPEPNEQITETQFINVLGEKLVSDGILKGSQSKALTNKLRGIPAEDKAEEVAGIEVEKLDSLIRVLKDNYGLFSAYNDEDFTFPWVTFESKIFPTPSYLEKLLERGYYKFLSPAEMISVDRYVQRRVAEIRSQSANVFTYTAYYWDEEDKKANVAILQLNRYKKTAFYSEYVKIKNNQWVANNVLSSPFASTDSYKVGVKSLELNLISEDPNKPFISGYCFLAINTEEFYSLDYMKGVMAAIDNSGKPSSKVIVLKREDNYQKALEVVKDETKRVSDLAYAVLDTHIKIEEENLTALNKLETFSLSRLIGEISGAYSHVIVIETSSMGNRGDVGVSTCYIQKDGVVFINSHTDGKHVCYIEPKYLGENVICIRHFFDDGGERIHYDYKLQIVRSSVPGDKSVIALKGVYSTIFRGGIISGSVIFTPRNWQSIEEAKAALPTAALTKDVITPHSFKEYVESSHKKLMEIEKERSKLFENSGLKYSES